MNSLILTTIIAALFIIGLNVFLFRRKIQDLLDFPVMWASNFSKSIFCTFFVIILIYLVGFYFGAFSNLMINTMIFFVTIAGMIAAIYGMGLKKRWFMFFWLGIVISSLIITIQQIDQYTIPIWSLIIMGLMLMNLHYYNKEKDAFYI